MPLPPVLRRPSRALSMLAFVVLISACGSPTAALPPTAATSLAPTSAPPAATAATAATAPTEQSASTATPAATNPPAATTVATSAPTSVPVDRGITLPAPLYYLDNSQIWRLEPDGTTKRQISFDGENITGFEIASATNSLVYSTGEGENVHIVMLDESGRRDRMSGPLGYGTIAPDASRIAVDVAQPIAGLQIGRDASDTGVFLQDRLGGRPGLLVADTSLEQHHLPNAWSPDGARLLVTASGYPNKSDLVIYTLADGQSVPVSEGCCEAVWSADGKTLLVAGGVDPEFSYRGAWRVDAATGKAQQLFADASSRPLVTLPQQAADGSVLAFIDQVGALQGPAQLKLARIGADGSLILVSDTVYNLIDGVWSPDGSGMLGTLSRQNGNIGELLWIPSDGGVATALGVDGYNLRWGNANAAPAPFACDAFNPLAMQPAETRQVQPEVIDLQGRLIALGYLPAGSNDGLFGDQTRTALEAFQGANNLPVSGTLDCASWQVLLGGRAKAQ